MVAFTARTRVRKVRVFGLPHKAAMDDIHLLLSLTPGVLRCGAMSWRGGEAQTLVTVTCSDECLLDRLAGAGWRAAVTEKGDYGRTS